MAGRTWIGGTVQLSAGAAFFDPEGRFGNVAFKLNNCSVGQVTIQTPMNKTITLS